jgi:hypothetical protein
VLAFVALALGTARGAVKDPRKCSISTAAYCASHAAGKVAIAKIKADAVAPVQAHCSQAGPTLLRWKCLLNDSGGHGWNVSVVYRGTPAGWRMRATVLSHS